MNVLNHMTMLLSHIDEGMRKGALAKIRGENESSMPVPEHVPEKQEPFRAKGETEDKEEKSEKRRSSKTSYPPIDWDEASIITPIPISEKPGKGRRRSRDPVPEYKDDPRNLKDVLPLPKGKSKLPPGLDGSRGDASRMNSGGGPFDPATKSGNEFRGGVSRGFQDALDKIQKGMMSRHAGGQAGGLVGGLGSALGTAFPTIAAPLKMTEALARSTDAVRQMTNQLHENNIRFAEFSGPMAAVDIRQQAREINLARERGSFLAPSAEQLAASSFSMGEAWAPIEDRIATSWNRVLAMFSDVGTAGGGEMQKLINFLSGKGYTPMAAADPKDNPQDWLRSREDANWDAYGRPKRFP